MKKLLPVLVIIASLALGGVAQGQNFSISFHSWDLLWYSLEGEYYVMPHLSVDLGAGGGIAVVGLMGGARYFDSPDWTGLFGSGHLIVASSSNLFAPPTTSTRVGLYTSAGYRWMVGSGQYDFELGLIWSGPCPGCSVAIPVVSWGFGLRF